MLEYNEIRKDEIIRDIVKIIYNNITETSIHDYF